MSNNILKVSNNIGPQGPKGDPGDGLTDAEIKTAYENNANTNAFTDAEKAKLSSLTNLAFNPTGTTAPGPNNDINDSVNANDGVGFVVGSFWIDTVADESYRCIDNTDSAAVWVKTTLTTDELAAVAVTGNSDDLTEGSTNLLMTVAERAKLSNLKSHSTGILTGGVLTTGAGAAEFSISDGTGLVVDAAGAITSVSWTGKTNITPIGIGTGNTLTFIALDSAGNVVQSLTRFSNEDHRDYIVLGAVVHIDDVNVDTVANQQHVAFNTGSSLSDLHEAMGFFNISGNVFSANGANLFLNKSNGYMFAEGSNYHINPQDPNRRNLPVLNALSFRYVFNNGDSSASSPNFDPANLDDGAGGLTPLTNNNRWSVQRVYSFVGNAVGIQRGVTEYSSQELAIAGITTEPYFPAPFVAANGLLRGWIVAKKDATALNNTSQAVFIEAPKFPSTTGGLGVGAGSLQDAYLNSVQPQIITDATNGRVEYQTYSGGNAEDVFAILNDAGDDVLTFKANGTISNPNGSLTLSCAASNNIIADLDTTKRFVIKNSADGVGTPELHMWHDDHSIIESQKGNLKLRGVVGTGAVNIEAQPNVNGIIVRATTVDIYQDIRMYANITAPSGDLTLDATGTSTSNIENLIDNGKFIVNDTGQTKSFEFYYSGGSYRIDATTSDSIVIETPSVNGVWLKSNSAPIMVARDADILCYRGIAATGAQDIGDASGGAFDNLYLDSDIINPTGSLTIDTSTIAGSDVIIAPGTGSLVINNPTSTTSGSLSHDNSNFIIQNDRTGAFSDIHYKVTSTQPSSEHIFFHGSSEIIKFQSSTALFNYGLTIRQSGGTAGTDELWIYHASTGSHIATQSEDLIFDATASAGGNVITTPNATGAFIVRQDGGVAGTDEIQFYHNGADGHIHNKSGILVIDSDAGDLFLRRSGSDMIHLDVNGIEFNTSLRSGNSNVDLGAVSDEFRHLRLTGTIYNDSGDLTFDATGTAGSNIILTPNGTGVVRIEDTDTSNNYLDIYTNGTSTYLEAHGSGSSGQLHCRGESVWAVFTGAGYTKQAIYLSHSAENIAMGFDLRAAGTVDLGTTSNPFNVCRLDAYLSLAEITTPTAETDRGAVYTKTDNKLYFQDGAGTEHEVAFV